MHSGETELEMVRRHVRAGGEIVASQRALVDRLTNEGLSSEDACALLIAFENTQRLHEKHLLGC